jgi:hypothetical protein
MIEHEPKPAKLRSRPWYLLVLSMLMLSACAGTPFGSRVEQSLETDPQLQDSGILTADSSTQSPTADLPDEIPIYPDAKLAETPAQIKAIADDAFRGITYWTTNDSPAQVEQFYRNEFQVGDWELDASDASNDASNNASNNASSTKAPAEAAPEAGANDAISRDARDATNGNADASPSESASAPADNNANEALSDATTLIGRNGDLRVKVTILPENSTAEHESDPSTDGAAFTIQYRRSSTVINPISGADESDSSASENTSDTTTADATAADEEGFSIRANDADNGNRATGTSRPSTRTRSETGAFSDLNEASEDLRPYIQDLAALDLITAAPQENGSDQSSRADSNGAFQPNQAISRREYAKWLFAANNLIYADEPKERIRPGVESADPIFEDVPTSDPDFEVIQGLAEAGLIPSPLSGSSTSVNFRPDAPLTREDLLLWKVPLDTRQALPTATVEAVKEAWGFQDAGKIDPNALRAVLADHQQGDMANIPRAFGYTTLLQPQKAATRAEAAAVLWRFGNPTEGVSAADVLQSRESGSNRSASS